MLLRYGRIAHSAQMFKSRIESIFISYSCVFDDDNRNVTFIRQQKDSRIVWYEALKVMQQIKAARIQAGKKPIKLEASIAQLRDILGESSDAFYDFLRNWGEFSVKYTYYDEQASNKKYGNFKMYLSNSENSLWQGSTGRDGWINRK